MSRIVVKICVLFVACLLSACGNIKNVISFSTPYEQPQSEPRARIRVISFNGMVRAVPNSDCVDWSLPNTGVMAVSRKGFVEVNDRVLGMPQGKFPDIKSKDEVVAVSELYIRAGSPIVIDYLSMGQSSIGGPGYYQCFIRKSFVPVAGSDYEAVFSQDERNCRFGISRIAEGNESNRIQEIELKNATFCHFTDNL